MEGLKEKREAHGQLHVWKCLEAFPWSAPSLSLTWPLPLTGAARESRAGPL